jgi:hypothetical protein
VKVKILGKVHKPPLNYHQIDNVLSKLLIVTMSPQTTKTLSTFPPMTKLLSVKKILKLLKKKNIKLKKLKKSKGWKIKKTNPLYKKKMN